MILRYNNHNFNILKILIYSYNKYFFVINISIFLIVRNIYIYHVWISISIFINLFNFLN